MAAKTQLSPMATPGRRYSFSAKAAALLIILNEVNPIVITGATEFSTDVLANLVFIKLVRWYRPATAGHLLSLTDGGGKLLLKDYCVTANKSKNTELNTKFRGIACDDLDSGEVHIYIR